MSGDRVGKVLERVARDVSLVAYKNGHGAISEFERVLEERLGPLLRAGQEVRDEAVRCYSHDGKGNSLTQAWDAALAALERESGHEKAG